MNANPDNLSAFSIHSIADCDRRHQWRSSPAQNDKCHPDCLTRDWSRSHLGRPSRPALCQALPDSDGIQRLRIVNPSRARSRSILAESEEASSRTMPLLPTGTGESSGNNSP